MDTHRIILILLALVVNVIIINYVQKLEDKKCDCSHDWRREFIKIFAIVTVLLITLVIVMHIVKIKVPRIFARLFRVFFGLYGLVGIVNIIALFTYSQKMMMTNHECPCSEYWERTFIYYYSMIIAVFYLAIIVAQISLYVKCRQNYLPYINSIMKTQKNMCSRSN
jgi:hypothetical protein